MLFHSWSTGKRIPTNWACVLLKLEMHFSNVPAESESFFEAAMAIWTLSLALQVSNIKWIIYCVCGTFMPQNSIDSNFIVLYVCHTFVILSVHWHREMHTSHTAADKFVWLNVIFKLMSFWFRQWHQPYRYQSYQHDWATLKISFCFFLPKNATDVSICFCQEYFNLDCIPSTPWWPGLTTLRWVSARKT